MPKGRNKIAHLWIELNGVKLRVVSISTPWKVIPLENERTLDPRTVGDSLEIGKLIEKAYRMVRAASDKKA